MKSKKTLVILSALAAVCLISCNKDEEVSMKDGAVRFTAGIGKEAVATPQSRAAGTEWAAMDKIGIFMVKSLGIDIVESADNKQYTTAKGDGTFTPVIGGGNEIYYPMDNSLVDFIAYYPYKDNATLSTSLDIEIATLQSDVTQAATDLMWAKADNSGQSYNKDKKATVDFTFGHCLSKLTMNCIVDANIGLPELLKDATVTIKGMSTKSTFDLAGGKVEGNATATANITPRKLSHATNGFHGTYDAILLPGMYDANALTVNFTIDQKTFIWDVGTITFEPGKEYIYKVTIRRTGVEATGTIVAWVPVEKGPMTVE